MRAACGFLSRALFAVGLVVLVVGVIVVGLSIYVGTWPLRRGARKSPAVARTWALQSLLVALVDAAAAFRGRT